MQRVSYETGDVIFSEGTPSDVCYQILSGAVEIFVTDPETGAETSVGICRAGEIIGEMGVICEAPRSASARAAEAVVCKSYDHDEIIGLLTDEPREALAYVRSLIQRIRNTNNRAFLPGRRDG